MFVRNFFTKAVAERTGSYAFFDGSILGVEAYFKVCFTRNNFFCLKIDEGTCGKPYIFHLQIEEGRLSKPYIRVKYFPSHGGFFIHEVEIFNPESGLYEHMPVSEKDLSFLRHVLGSSYSVLLKAEKKWYDNLGEGEIPY